MPLKNYSLSDKKEIKMELLLTDKDGRKLWRNDEGNYLIDIPGKDNSGFDRSFLLEFQKGPRGEVGVNGLTNEIIIECLLKRLLALQTIAPCDLNLTALYHLDQALSVLVERENILSKGGELDNTGNIWF